MKKVIYSIELLLICVILSGCAREYSNWQTVTRENVGTFSVPTEWTVTEEDGFMVIYDESDPSGKKICLIEVEYKWELLEGGVKDYLYIYNPKIGKHVVYDHGSPAYSNSYGGGYMTLHLADRDLFYMSLIAYGSGYIRFVVWDDYVEEKMLKEICDSFYKVEE